MNAVLRAILFALAMSAIAVPTVHADTPLPENAELDGLYPLEREILDEISAVRPDLARDLRERLARAGSFAERKRILSRRVSKHLKQIEKAGAWLDKERAGYVWELLWFFRAMLDSAYKFEPPSTGVGLFSNIPWRGGGDLSPLTPAEKRALGIPLSEEEKRASGLEDLTPEEKARLKVPLSPEERRRIEAGGAQTDETSQVPVIPGEQAQPVGYSNAFDIAPGSAFSLSFDAGYGQIDRGEIQLPLRVETGGMFQEAMNIDPGWNDTFSASGRIELGLGAALSYRPEVLARKRLGLSLGYLSSDAGGSIDFIEGGDADPFLDGSVLLDPGGLLGGIGGGGIKVEDNGIGFADHRDVRADSEYEAFRVGLDFSNSYGSGDFLVRPRTGLYYRFTDEDVSISGTTGNGLVDYRYRNDLKSDRLGAEIALETKFQATDALRFTVTPRIALSQVWASGKSALDVDVGGAAFASSSESGIDETFTSLEYSLSAGVEYDLSDNATATLGASWDSGENPALEFEPEERANIDSQRYHSWTITGGVRINF